MAISYEFVDRKQRTIAELARILEEKRAQGKVIVHCHGTYDHLHPGHIHQFVQAKAKGDILVVTLSRDEHIMKGPGRPYFNETLRLQEVAALDMVDFVAFSEWPTAVESIKTLRPHYFVKGEEFKSPTSDKNSPIALEIEAVKEVGGEMFFTQMIDIHSTEILNDFFPVFPSETTEFLRAIKQRYTVDSVVKYIDSLKPLRILLIGEAIIDRYRFMHLLGKSPKGGMVAKHFQGEESFLGGILAAANHVANFCENVEVVSLLGRKNSQEGFIKDNLRPNISARFFYHPEGSTTVKERDVDFVYFAKHGETYFWDDKPLPPELETDIEKYLERRLAGFDLVLAVDYGHRLFTPKLMELITSRSNFLALNAQANAANFGFNVITKWPRADFIVLDERELRLSTHDEHSDIQNLISGLQKQKPSFFRTIAVPRGNHGSIVFNTSDGFKSAPAFSTKVVDTVGAGTAYIAMTAPLAAAEVPTEIICFLGNIAGAMNVSNLANKKPTERGSLLKFLNSILK